MIAVQRALQIAKPLRVLALEVDRADLRCRLGTTGATGPGRRDER
jgi:hypothetical protein